VELSQRWDRDAYIELDALAEVIVATTRELAISAALVREDEGADQGEGLGGRIVISSSGDHLVVDVRAPVEIRGEMELTGYGFQLDTQDIGGPWEPFYLLMAHLATALGARPEEPFVYEDETSFVEEVRSWVDACVDDHLTEASIEPGTIPLAIEASPGAIGPFRLEWRRDASGLVLDVRGAGTDLRVTVGGRVLELSEAQLAPLIEILRGEELAERVDHERALAMGTSAPAEAPAYGGTVMLYVWVGGVCVRSEVLDESGPVRSQLEGAAREGLCDVVRYLSNGTPLLRWVATELSDRHQSIADLERLPTWRWCPVSTEEAARVFREVVRLMGPPPGSSPETWN